MRMKNFLNTFLKKNTAPNKEENKKFIEKEIENLKNIKEGIILNNKEETDTDFYLNVTINKNILGIESEFSKNKVPDYIVFLIIIDCTDLKKRPPILAKSNFCHPSLMDGRDLSKEICPYYEPGKTKLEEIILEIPKFVQRVVNSGTIRFYGEFQLGATYNLKNFENMLVNIFSCKVVINNDEDRKIMSPAFNPNLDYMLILSGDALILFDKMETENGKIYFWASLYSLTDLQFNKKEKIVNLNFYDNEKNSEYHLKLYIENILFFRDTLVKKMGGLRIKSETVKLIKGKENEKRLTNKEIEDMSDINILEKHIYNLKQRIEKGEVNDYTVHTFTRLCGKAIEHYFNTGEDKKQSNILNIMHAILSRKDVDKLTSDDLKEVENASKEALN